MQLTATLVSNGRYFRSHLSSGRHADQSATLGANESNPKQGFENRVARQKSGLFDGVQVPITWPYTARQTRSGFSVPEEGDFRARLLLAQT